jgi:hypothetical protein
MKHVRSLFLAKQKRPLKIVGVAVEAVILLLDHTVVAHRKELPAC